MNWLYLVQQISTDVVARLSAAGLPPLLEGAILIGPQHTAENASPNRIWFVPKGSTFTPRDASMRQGVNARAVPEGAGVLGIAVTVSGRAYTTATVTVSAPDLAGGVQATATATLGDAGVARIRMTAIGSGYTSTPTVTITGDGTGATATAILAPTTEQLAAMHQRPLWTEWNSYEVHLWGATYVPATPPATGWQIAASADTDWDATATLYEVVLQSLAVLAHGVHRVGPMQWVSSQPQAPKLNTIGRYATMTLELATPVPDVLLATPAVGVVGSITTSMQLPDGTTGQGCAD